MRPQRAVKAKRVSYAEANAQNSDDSATEETAAQVNTAPDGDKTENNNMAPPDQDQNKEVAGSDVESETSSLDDAPRGKFGVKLPKRTAIHTIPPYPTDPEGTRVYNGPLLDEMRGTVLLKQLYGPSPDHLAVIRGLVDRWFGRQVLPAAQIAGRGVMKSPWLAADFEEKQKRWASMWYARLRDAKADPQQRLRKILSDHVALFKPPSDEMVCFVGPHDAQKQIKCSYGFSEPVSEAGAPLETTTEEATTPKGWLLDSGGIPLAIAWAPQAGPKEQFLAVCSIPFTDQEPKDGDSPPEDPDEMKKGTLQIWSVPCHKDHTSRARIAMSLSFDWGRPKRLQWCPVVPPDESKIGLLAVLCGDGLVRLIEVARPAPEEDLTHQWVTSPVATFGLPDEYGTKATALTWLNLNRLCIGHSDGTVTLWSICPRFLITRRAIHPGPILDMSSGFPSHPFHITTIPVSGSPTLTDLNLPSSERTSIATPRSSVNTQPNLLDWNDHLQGFFHLRPSAEPTNTVVGWAHIRYFVASRTLATTASPPTCLASGRTHPFTLIGCADGSVWAINPLRGLFRKGRSQPTFKLQLLRHEFRRAVGGPECPPRGAVRVLQGFRPEFNANPRSNILELERFMNHLQKAAQGKRRGGGGNSSKSKARGDDGGVDDDDDDDLEGGPLGMDGLTVNDEVLLQKQINATKMVVHEPRTRITMVAWNPNVEYGWWAAVAMGSGLVKIMDLGLESTQGET